MKRLLLPLLAALALPTAVNAETVWLVMNASSAMVTIPTKSMEDCEAQGKVWKKANFRSQMLYVCLIGK